MNLRDYQKNGIEKALRILEHRYSAYIADEMGLGKSIQAIKVAEALDAKAILVVCPAGLRLNWQSEFQKWHNAITAYPILSNGDFKKLNIDSPYHVVIVSYDLAHTPTALNYLSSRVWELVIFDEAHYLKNSTSKRTKACFGAIWNSSLYKLLLSGTPCPNGIIDGFTQFNKLAPELFPNKYKFGFRYTNATKNWFTGDWQFKGGKNLSELRSLLQSTFMVRRTKKLVLQELPDKIYSTIPISIGNSSSYCISEGEAELIREGKTASASEELATKRRGLGLLKVSAAAELINNIMLEKNRLVVFAYHRDVIESLYDLLKFKTYKITGGTSASDRHKYITEFQSDDPTPLIIIGQIVAAGVGITLTAADICMFIELDWSPANMAQAIDRLHRIGQKNAVQVQYLVAKNTLDMQIIGTLRSKIESINQVFRSESVLTGNDAQIGEWKQ